MPDPNDVDLDGFNLSELHILRNRVEKAIDTYLTRKRRETVEAITNVAKEHGFTLSELFGELPKVGKPKRVAAAKYANPYNPEQTWSGRGRRLEWVSNALADGKSISDLVISG
ncbi:MAG: H-NS histone family protein [Gemmobacter sp.]|jgi:DNA-binding protein H-NS|nr:H-NS histone family protein [Gemmobacter sp.]